VDKVNAGADPEAAKNIANALNQILADEYVLVVKLKKYHWNLKGPNFIELHLLFDRQYGEVSDIIDAVAEMTRALGFTADGSMKEFLDKTSLKEDLTESADAAKMNLNLMSDHEALIRNMRTVVSSKDCRAITEVENFLQDKIERHGKMAWFLRMYNA
jgi:starvation-inducible DNA-binding protein